MKVSVLMAVYNGERTLKLAIDSILAQSYSDFELVIVDDGSTDLSGAIIKAYKNDKIKYFKQKNSGSPAAPRNLAAKKASGELLALCDQDDVWYVDKLEKQVETYEKYRKEVNEEIGLIYSRASIINEKGGVIGLSQGQKGLILKSADAHKTLLNGIFIIACSALFTKSAYAYAGGFDETLVGNDEYDLWLKITKKYGVLAIPEVLCSWRSSTTSLSHKISRMYIENEKIFSRLLADRDEIKNVGSEYLKTAHAKNINRIIVALLMEKDFYKAKKYAIKARKINGNSLKGTALTLITAHVPQVSYLAVTTLRIFNKNSI